MDGWLGERHVKAYELAKTLRRKIYAHINILISQEEREPTVTPDVYLSALLSVFMEMSFSTTLKSFGGNLKVSEEYIQKCFTQYKQEYLKLKEKKNV